MYGSPEYFALLGTQNKMAEWLGKALAPVLGGKTLPHIFSLHADRNKGPFNPLQTVVGEMPRTHFTVIEAPSHEAAYQKLLADLARRRTFKKKRAVVYVLRPPLLGRIHPPKGHIAQQLMSAVRNQQVAVVLYTEEVGTFPAKFARLA